jgi:prepilin-type N-terminal cleavage/methylation domain-containing protein
MPKMTALSLALRKNRSLRGFSLVELLTVMAIIAVLAALTLGAAAGVKAHAFRNRAQSEIEAMKAGLESYKIDNGAYPVGTTAVQPAPSSLLGPPGVANYPLDPTNPSGVNFAAYQTASQALFQALYGAAYIGVAPAAGVKSYMNFNTSQVGSPNGPTAYVKDPWNNPYGYSTGDVLSPQVQYPFNGTGSFDLWTTAGNSAATASLPNPVNAWITNWQ